MNLIFNDLISLLIKSCGFFHVNRTKNPRHHKLCKSENPYPGNITNDWCVQKCCIRCQYWQQKIKYQKKYRVRYNESFLLLHKTFKLIALFHFFKIYRFIGLIVCIQFVNSTHINLPMLGQGAVGLECPQTDSYFSIVDRSPAGSSSSQAFRTRRMILPLRVFGRKSRISISFGAACAASPFLTNVLSSFSSSSPFE